MNLASTVLRTKENIVYLSRYDVIQAFFRTEDEENEDMARELNVLLNHFCTAERNNGKNINELPFSRDLHQKPIAYIKSVLNE